MSEVTSAGSSAASSPGHVGRTRTTTPAGAYQRAWRRFRRNPTAMAGLVVLILILLFVLLADGISTYITGFDYSENHLDAVLVKPGDQGYILGSDGNGRDILTRLAFGGRVSMLVAVLATMTTLLIGGTLGLIAGYAGGVVDSVLMRTADVFLSIPALSILILIAALYRPDQYELAIVIALVLWPGVSRLIRGEALALRKRDYIEAARVLGAGDAQNYCPPSSAQCAANDHRLGVPCHSGVHPHRGGAQFPWTRGAVADAFLGEHAFRSATVLSDQLDQRLFPRSGNLSHCPIGQSGGKWTP